MNQTSIKNIGVCGAGTMGCGITQVGAQNGFDTILYDVQYSMLDKSRITIERNLGMMVEKGKMKAQEKDAILDRVKYTTNIADCQAGLIIEAIVEKLEEKGNLFNQLSALNSTSTILATNTSS